MSTLIFGRSWEDIQATQSGKSVCARPVPNTLPPLATSRDLQYLNSCSIQELLERKLFGVLDRLWNSELLIEDEHFTASVTLLNRMANELDANLPLKPCRYLQEQDLNTVMYILYDMEKGVSSHDAFGKNVSGIFPKTYRFTDFMNRYRAIILPISQSDTQIEYFIPYFTQLADSVLAKVLP